MRIALVIALRILRQRIRDRTGIIFAVATPLGLAIAFSLLIPNDFSTYHTKIAMVDQDGGQMAQVLVEDVFGQLASADVADLEPMDSRDEAERAVRDGDAGAALVIPAGFTDLIMSGRKATLTIVAGDATVAEEVARATAARFAADVGAVQLMVATDVAAGGAADAATIANAQAAVQEPSPIDVTDNGTERLQANLATFYGASMAIMFVFFATQYGALAILTERQTGTLNRLLASPISPGSILFGSALAGLALGFVSMCVLLLATTVLVHASWGPPALVLLLIIAAVFAAMGISMAVATLARTVRQAGNLNAIVAISLSAIGGVFIPLSQAPAVLVTISQITPHAWFLRGIDTLSGPNPTLVEILPPIGVLLAMGTVLGAIGLVRARRALVPA